MTCYDSTKPMTIPGALSTTNLLLILLSAFILGLAKAGLKGIDMLNVTLMALVFGGKASTGIVLPLLCAADIAAVWYYHRHAQWHHFRKLMPWMVLGILIGVYTGKNLDEAVFRRMMALIIVFTVGMLVFMEVRKSDKVPTHPLFASTTGIAAGFTTMIGNLAGAFASLYFLAMRMPKNDFIGTAAWVFLVINFFKLPFQAFYWKNISVETLQVDLLLLPALALGFLSGLKLVSRISDVHYRKVVFALTVIGAVVMLVRR
jgi:uncharacterized membrane protein YfcA